MAGGGRKKTELKLIERKDSRLVCFSKRRSGLFKKARELSILSGAQIGALVFSPAGKPFVSDAGEECWSTVRRRCQASSRWIARRESRRLENESGELQLQTDEGNNILLNGLLVYSVREKNFSSSRFSSVLKMYCPPSFLVFLEDDLVYV
ncbi:MADS-box transcription factor 2-like [Phalaenopsis equestris]|uniref:MADS-box transcription factor 2-like n=1 Tax=Phalaenopsis equestris TaxID=78828 RepID=UPI0009E357D3|nr:MADS-box transcription factor 2-like [Phalaenopsis equestris]